MSRYVTCCPKCLENISRQNSLAGRYWMDLCAFVTSNGNIIRASNFVSVLEEVCELLEHDGYIITTDCTESLFEDAIDIFVLGHQVLEKDVELFCIGGHHD